MTDAIEKTGAAQMQHIDASTPMGLIALAQSQNAGVEQLQQLFELQMRWEANEARKAYNDAISKFKSEEIRIVKDSEVDFKTQKGRTRYKFTTLAHVVNSVVPVLARYGLTHSWETDQTDKNEIIVTCKLSHREGHSESITLRASADNTGNKNPIQQVGSTVKYLQRYTLVSILGLASSDDDDGNGSELNPDDYLSESQVAEIKALLDEVRGDGKLDDEIGAFLGFAGYPTLESIPRVKYQQCIAAIDKKRGAK